MSIWKLNLNFTEIIIRKSEDENNAKFNFLDIEL